MKTLACQGGGFLGYGPAATVFPTLERLADRPICEQFDLIGGTSVGAINGGCLAAGISTKQLLSFYVERGPEIFKSSFLSTLRRRISGSAKYSPLPLETALRDILGERTLADCKTRFIATAVDMVSGRNVYFQSYGKSRSDADEIIIGPDSGIKLWQVLRASSAAQTFFPGFRWNDMVFWDGGSTGCNAPDMLVLTESMQFDSWWHTSMLSIGAGWQAWSYLGQDMQNPGLVKALTATLEIAYAGPEASQTWQAKEFLEDRYVRLNPTLGVRLAIDDASEMSRGVQEVAWRGAVSENLLKLR